MNGLDPVACAILAFLFYYMALNETCSRKLVIGFVIMSAVMIVLASANLAVTS
jgi:hypothetical protein